MNAFTEFYGQYPRKVAKAHAEKMWNRLKESEKQDALAALPYHIRVWEKEKRSMAMVPHAGSWIGGKRWQDEETGAKHHSPLLLEPEPTAPTHLCEGCSPHHEWECQQPFTCSASKDLCCPTFASRYLPKGKGV